MARLKITAPDGIRDVVLGERLTIGRVEGADLVLDDKGISRKHCELAKDAKAKSGWTIRDLGSSNGTFVNGDKIADARPLADGDSIRIGGLTLTFLERDSDCALRFTAGEHAGREIPLSGARTTLGRRPDNAIAFVDVKVSGVHLEIVKEGEGFVLRDLGSTNGTFLDGRKVTEVALSHNDKVKLGDSEFTFVDARRGATADASGELDIAGPARLTVPTGPKKGKAAALAGLAGVTIVVAAAAGWYFLYARGGEATTGGGPVPDAPAGTLLGEDWSFEDAAAAETAWTAELGLGFSVRRGTAASGSSALVANVEGGHVATSRRQAEEISAARALSFSGQLRADDGALVSAALQFLRAADDPVEPRSLSVVAARVQGGGFTPFDVEITPPAWAKRVEVVVVARGEGSVAVDDLALVPGSGPASRGSGELALLPRGAGAFVVDHRAPLIELFIPFGSGTAGPIESGESADSGEDVERGGAAAARVELPPGAFDAEVSNSGSQLTLARGSRFAADGFAALCTSEIAAAGVTLVGARASEQRYGAFEVEGVSKLLLGSAAERCELALSKPTRVTGLARGDALEIRLHTPADLTVAWRTGFDNERKEASELLAKAQEDWRARRAGHALAKLKDLRDRLPHDEKTMSAARALAGEIVPMLEAELVAIDADATAAEFLGSLERSRKTLARAQTMLAQAEGLDSAKELAARVERMTSTVAAMEREQRETEARRLLRLARAYQAQQTPAPDRSVTAAELLAELQQSYADTAAAKEAAGTAAEGGR